MHRHETTLRLIDPDVAFEKSHESYLAEFRLHGERVHPSIVAEPYDDFPGYVAMLKAATEGKRLPPGYVAHSTFWLVNADGQIVAVSNLRHELNDFLLRYGGHVGYGVRPSARRRGYATQVLRQTLLAAKKRGIERVRITCSKDNVASVRTILRNGGQLDDEVETPDDEIVCRYWIDL